MVFETTMASLGLQPRPQQTKLVDYARQSLADDKVSFVQAGTGTGKSFALLTTALEAAKESGDPTLVICPNNSLIDQYVNKDAPTVQGVAGGRFVHIKGRSRYACANSRAWHDKPDRTARQEYRSLTRAGRLEWSELGLTMGYACPGSDYCDSSNNMDCLCPDGTPRAECQCPYVCGAFEAKRRAMTADVVITNAHVLVWDYLIRGFTNGAAQLLPDAGAVFIDECHELEGVGRDCVSDEIKPGSKVYDVIPGLSEWAATTAKAMRQVRQTEALLSIDADVQGMAQAAAEEAEDLEGQASAPGVDAELAKSYRREAKRLQRFVNFVSESDQFISTIELIEDRSHPEGSAIHLKRRCVDSSLMFRDILTAQPSVLVSGTIPATTPRRLGVGDSPLNDVGHPFDYAKSTLAISPHSPKDRSHFMPRVEQVAQAINSTGGGTLVLFTSWSDVELIAPILARKLDPAIAAEVYVQSREDPASLKQDVAEFAANGNAVLIGVRSLFTGLDIPGPALRQVIIWKMPYAVPTLEWQAIQKIHGRQVYFDDMLTVLTQGVGRLVRTVDDCGRVFIVDNRASNQQWAQNHMTRHINEFSKWVRPKR